MGTTFSPFTPVLHEHRMATGQQSRTHSLGEGGGEGEVLVEARPVGVRVG